MTTLLALWLMQSQQPCCILTSRPPAAIILSSRGAYFKPLFLFIGEPACNLLVRSPVMAGLPFAAMSKSASTGPCGRLMGSWNGPCGRQYPSGDGHKGERCLRVSAALTGCKTGCTNGV